MGICGFFQNKNENDFSLSSSSDVLLLLVQERRDFGVVQRLLPKVVRRKRKHLKAAVPEETLQFAQLLKRHPGLASVRGLGT